MVVVFTPPPVEAGDAPMNIKMTDHQLGGFPHGFKVNGVEARRAQGHGLEKSVQQLVAEGHAFCAQRGGIASFQQQEAQRTDDQQPQRYRQYQLGVQG